MHFGFGQAYGHIKPIWDLEPNVDGPDNVTWILKLVFLAFRCKDRDLILSLIFAIAIIAETTFHAHLKLCEHVPWNSSYKVEESCLNTRFDTSIPHFLWDPQFGTQRDVGSYEARTSQANIDEVPRISWSTQLWLNVHEPRRIAIISSFDNASSFTSYLHYRCVNGNDCMKRINHAYL